MKAHRPVLSLLFILTLSGLSGCASWPNFKPTVPDVKPMRKARAAQMIKEYEQHRNDAQYQAAVSAWKQGNTDSCRELIDTLLERAPQHRGGRLMLVQLEMLEQELKEARTDIDKLVKEFPDDAEVLHVKGLVCEADGELEQAEKCYRRAIEIAPGNEIFAASLECLVDADPQDAAAARPAKAPKRTPAGRDTNRLSATMLKAEVQFALGESESAQRLVERLLSQMPDQEELETLLTRICETPVEITDRQPVHPTSYQAVSKGPTLKRGHHGDENPPPSFHPTGSTASMTAATKPAEATRPQSAVEEAMRLGENALATDKPTAARSYFQRAIAAAPEDETVVVNAAVASLRHEHPELAAEFAQSALSRWPKSAALYRTLGMAEYRLEHWQPAQAALRQSLSLDNSHALSYFLLGCTLSKLGQNEEAERNFNQARQLDSRYALKP